MRRAKRQITDAARLRDLIEACQVLRVGATDAEGMFIVPVSFGYTWEDGTEGPRLSFYLHSAAEGRKAAALSAGGAAGAPVAVELDCDRGNITGDYACAWSRAYASVMGSGRAHPVTDPAEKERGLALLMAHAAPGAPARFEPAAVARVAVFRIDVDEFTGKERAAKA